MEYDHDIDQYREHLLSRLHQVGQGSDDGRQEFLHLFVNEQRVGSLDARHPDTTLQVQTRFRIHSVHVRSESGMLLGGVCPPEYGLKIGRIPLQNDALDLQIQNYVEGGSVSATVIHVPTVWHRFWRFVYEVTGVSRHHPASQIPSWGVRSLVFVQILLAVSVLGLAVDKIIDWRTTEPLSSSPAPMDASLLAAIERVQNIDHRLTESVQLQTKIVDAVQVQQQGIAQLQRTMTKLSATQETVVASVVTTREEIDKRQKGSQKDIEQMARLLIRRAQNEQEELQAEIHSLTVANDRLNKERSDLEHTNRELKERLKAAGIDMSKATPSSIRSGEVTEGRQAPATTQIADGSRTSDTEPFVFWVTFQEGATEDSIEKWVLAMKGRKGMRNDVWQAVEVVQPSDPPRFMNQIREAKIVKALRVNP